MRTVVVIVVLGALFGMAGQAFTRGDRTIEAVLAVAGILVLLCYGHECREQGANPRRRVRHGRYEVVGVVEQWRDNLYLLALKRHVDFGHYEYRLVEIHWKLVGAPTKGDQIIVDSAGWHYDGPEPDLSSIV